MNNANQQGPSRQYVSMIKARLMELGVCMLISVWEHIYNTFYQGGSYLTPLSNIITTPSSR